MMGVPLAIGDDELNRPDRAGGIAVRLFLYLFVVWAALLIAQSLGGGLAEKGLVPADGEDEVVHLQHGGVPSLYIM